MKHIHIQLDDREYKKRLRIKNKYNLTWREMLRW